MKPVFTLMVAGMTLAAGGSVLAESNPSLGQARLAVIKGTSPGITLIPARPEPATAAAAASAPVDGVKSSAAPVPSAGTQPITQPATPSIGERLSALLRAGSAPSGESLNATKRLDAPSLGIALPTAASTRAAAAPPAKERAASSP